MVEPEDRELQDPLFEPRVIRFLKDRPRLVDKGVRKRLLEELENQVRERRKPDTVAEKAVRSVVRSVEQVGENVGRRRAKERLRQVNRETRVREL
jgi:hypothetical protein